MANIATIRKAYAAAKNMWQVGKNAEAAEQYGAEAMALAEAGDLDGAYDKIRAACKLERQCGDCPTWGPMHYAIEEVLKVFVDVPSKGGAA